MGAFQGLRRVPRGLCRRAGAAAWRDPGVCGGGRSAGSCFSELAQGARVSQGRRSSCRRGFTGEEGAGGQTHCMLGCGLRHRVRFRSPPRFSTVPPVQKRGHCLRASSWALLTLVAAQSPPWEVGDPNPSGATGSEETGGSGSMETGVQASPHRSGGLGGRGAAGERGTERPGAGRGAASSLRGAPPPSASQPRSLPVARARAQCPPMPAARLRHRGRCRRGTPVERWGAPHGAFPSAFLPRNACFSSVVLGHQIFLSSACAPLRTFQSRVTAWRKPARASDRDGLGPAGT